MRKAVIVLTLLIFAAPAISKTATLETDSTQTVNIGGEEIQYELIGVNPDRDNPEKVDATLIDADGMTHTIVSWNAHQYDLNGYPYTQSSVNGEEIVLDSWSGEQTDSNEDDVATLAWGRDYFHCEDYQTSENEYKFCGEETKTIEAGGGEVELDFQYSSTTNEHEEIKTAVFLNSDDGTITLVSPNAPQYDYTTSSLNGVQANVKQVRGALTDRNSDDAALIEIEEETEFADLGFSTTKSRKTVSMQSNTEATGGIDSFEWDVDGDGEYEETGRQTSYTYDSSGEKSITMRVTAGDSTETVTKTIEIETSEETGYEYGEKIWISEGDSINIEDHSFYFRTLVGNDEDGYEGLLWRPSRESSGNSPLNYMKAEQMDFRYGNMEDDLFGYVCDIDGGSSEAEIVLKEQRENPWSLCDRHPSELRTNEEEQFNMKNYELGNKVSLSEGEGLNFGDSTVYLEEIEEYGDRFSIRGDAEWTGPNSDWDLPSEGYTTVDSFYEGRISSGTCEVSNDEVEFVMEKTSNIPSNSEWPEDWCESDTGDGEPGKAICTDEYAPVCASKNGESQTYSNDCRAEQDGAEVLYSGECRENLGEPGEGTFEVELNPIDYNNDQGIAIFALPINGEVPLSQLSDDCPIVGGQVYGYDSGGTSTDMINGMRGYAAVTENTQSCTATVERSAVSGQPDLALPENDWVVASVPKEMNMNDLNLGQGCTFNGIDDTNMWEITNQGNQPLDQGTTLQPDGLYWIRAQGGSCQIEMDDEIFETPE